MKKQLCLLLAVTVLALLFPWLSPAAKAEERELTIPIEISGSEVSLNFNSKEVMDSITGGFYGTIEATK